MIGGVVGTALLLVSGTAGLVAGYLHLQHNIRTDHYGAVLEADPATRPPVRAGQDILLIGSDTRAGDDARYGDAEPAGPGRSDTTILLHVSADRRGAVGVSIPRDLMTEVPACRAADGTFTAPYFGMFNSAMETGGTACTVKSVEHLTGIRVDHVVTLDFVGFTKAVDALGGVPMHLDAPIDDGAARVRLPAGDVKLDGEQALGYVRARKSLGDGSDLQRIKRQQQFLAALAHTVDNDGLLTDPVRLYRVLDAVTKAVTTDPAIASLAGLLGLLRSLDAVWGHITFVTVPVTAYAPDPDRVTLDQPAADNLFASLTGTAAPGVTPSPAPSPR